MNTVLTLIKVGFVFGLLIVTLRMVGKLYGTGRGLGTLMGTKPAETVQVLGRQSVGRNADVTVVSVGDRTLVLGVTEHSVSVVTELEPEEFEPRVVIDATPARTQAALPSPSWRDLLESMRERTVRR